jgi:dihydrofolate reductase
VLCEKWIYSIFASPDLRQDGKLIIGCEGDMPWRGLIPSDMKRFKRLTSKCPVIIGRKTWDSIPEKFRPFDKNLPLEKSRQTLILTRDQDFKVDDPRVVVAHSLEEAVKCAKSNIVWVAGGAEIYALALPFTDFLHWTQIDIKCKGDTFFPEFDLKEWEMIDNTFYNAGGEASPNDKLNYWYKILEHKKKGV